MKKALAIFLAFFFAVSAMGLQVTVHHCQGKTSYNVLGVDFNKHCKCKHETESHKTKCCNSHSFTVKVAPEFSSSFKIILVSPLEVDKSLITVEPVFGLAYLSGEVLSTTDSSPSGYVVPSRAFLCVYRI